MSIDYDTILVRQNPDIKEIQTSIVAPAGTTGVGSGNWQPPEDSNGGDNTDAGGGGGGGDGGGGGGGGGDGIICPDNDECAAQDCNAGAARSNPNITGGRYVSSNASDVLTDANANLINADGTTSPLVLTNNTGQTLRPSQSITYANVATTVGGVPDTCGQLKVLANDGVMRLPGTEIQDGARIFTGGIGSSTRFDVKWSLLVQGSVGQSKRRFHVGSGGVNSSGVNGHIWLASTRINGLTVESNALDPGEIGWDMDAGIIRARTTRRTNPGTSDYSYVVEETNFPVPTEVFGTGTTFWLGCESISTYRYEGNSEDFPGIPTSVSRWVFSLETKNIIYVNGAVVAVTYNQQPAYPAQPQDGRKRFIAALDDTGLEELEMNGISQGYLSAPLYTITPSNGSNNRIHAWKAGSTEMTKDMWDMLREDPDWTQPAYCTRIT